MKTNYYAITNGKLVSISPMTMLKSQQQICSRVSSSKSAQMIAFNDNKPTSPKSDDKLVLLMKYYQEIIKKHEQRVKYLEKDLEDKSNIINNFKMFKEISCSSLDNIVHKQKISFNQLPNLLKSTSSSIQLCSQNLLQNFNQFKLIQQSLKKTRCSNHLSKYGSNLKQQKIELQEQSIQQHCQISASQQNQDMKKNSFIERVAPLNKMSFVLSEYESVSGVKKYFDFSSLMERLNKCSGLVKKIKKSLEGPIQSSSALSIKQFPIQSPPFIQQKKKNNPKIVNKWQQKKQIYQFVDIVIQKHQELIQLIEQLSIDKQQSIKQVKQYYQNIINKKQIQQVQQVKRKNLRTKRRTIIQVQCMKKQENMQYLTNINYEKDKKIKYKTLNMIQKMVNLQKIPNKQLTKKNQHQNTLNNINMTYQDNQSYKFGVQSQNYDNVQ